MEMHDVTAQDPKFLVFLKVSGFVQKIAFVLDGVEEQLQLNRGFNRMNFAAYLLH